MYTRIKPLFLVKLLVWILSKFLLDVYENILNVFSSNVHSIGADGCSQWAWFSGSFLLLKVTFSFLLSLQQYEICKINDTIHKLSTFPTCSPRGSKHCKPVNWSNLLGLDKCSLIYTINWNWPHFLITMTYL